MTDSLIEEVRNLRRQFVESAGSDLDEIALRLKQIEHEFNERSGRFTDVPQEHGDELFPQQTRQPENAAVNDIRPTTGT